MRDLESPDWKKIHYLSLQSILKIISSEGAESFLEEDFSFEFARRTVFFCYSPELNTRLTALEIVGQFLSDEREVFAKVSKILYY
jgi:hypothetical protein